MFLFCYSLLYTIVKSYESVLHVLSFSFEGILVEPAFVQFSACLSGALIKCKFLKCNQFSVTLFILYHSIILLS